LLGRLGQGAFGVLGFEFWVGIRFVNAKRKAADLERETEDSKLKTITSFL
jgi:hypothetical protein